MTLNRTNWASHVLGLWLACSTDGLSACTASELDDDLTASKIHREHDDLKSSDAGTPDECGDGHLQEREQCDSHAPGRQTHCDAQCRRTSYAACNVSSECPGLNSLCAAYDGADAQFCADYCEMDDTCPRLPGFDSVCNFAWCAIRCKDGDCPSGMTCVPEVELLDHTGQSRGTGDVCVPRAAHD